MKFIAKLYHSFVYYFFSKFDEACAMRANNSNIIAKAFYVIKSGFFFLMAALPVILTSIAIGALFMKLGVPMDYAIYYAGKIAALLCFALYLHGQRCKSFGY